MPPTPPKLRVADLLSRIEELEERVRRFEKEYPGHEVPLPPFWGGYLLRPEAVEFWTGAEDRLHHRTIYLRDGGGWRTSLLQP